MKALVVKLRRRLRPRAPASCAEVGLVLSAYLDGQLDHSAARRVAEHLEDCRRCGLELATYQALKEALRRRHSPPQEAVERLRAFAHGLAGR